MKKQLMRISVIVLTLMLALLSIPFSAMAETPTFANDIEAINYYGDFEKGYPQEDSDGIAFGCDSNDSTIVTDDTGSTGNVLKIDATSAVKNFTINYGNFQKGTYKLSFDFYIKSGSLVKANDTEPTIIVADRDNGFATVISQAYHRSNFNIGTWVTVSKYFEITASDLYSKISFNNISGAVFYIDNVRVENTLIETVDIKNNGFEDSSAWHGAATEYGVKMSTTKPHSGAQSLEIPAKDSDSGRWCGIYQSVQVSPNTDYVLSFYSYVDQSADNATNSKNNSAYARLYDSSKTSSIINGGNDYFLNNLGFNEWKLNTISFNSGNNTTLLLDFEINNHNNTYVDDVYMRKVVDIAISDNLNNAEIAKVYSTPNTPAYGETITVKAECYKDNYSLRRWLNGENAVIEELGNKTEFTIENYTQESTYKAMFFPRADLNEDTAVTEADISSAREAIFSGTEKFDANGKDGFNIADLLYVKREFKATQIS